MSALIVDASVTLKLVLNEPNSAQARSFVLSNPVSAPEFMLLECGNALWAATRRKLISPALATEGLARIASAPIEWLRGASQGQAALAIAFEIDRTIYDSLYLALAISLGSVLITADNKFAAAAEAHPVYRAFVRRLDES